MAVATPCWPAPVSATRRGLPIRWASSAWPSTLLILWEPVWLRSSRLSSRRRPSCSPRLWHSVSGRRPAGVVAQQRVELGAEGGIGPGVAEGRLQLLAGRHQRLGDEAPAELAEAAVGDGSAINDMAILSGRLLLVGPVVGQLVGPPVRHRGGGPGRLDERLQLDRVLAAGLPLDAGRHVDPPRLAPGGWRWPRCRA